MPNNNSSIELSQRELQVLEMVVTGASNKEIAQQLVISVNTVKVHMRNIFEKMGVQSRTEATLLAIQEGLVSVTDGGDSSDRVVDTGAPAAPTYLITPNHTLALPRWQQIYLLLALLLSLGVALLPLLPKTGQKTAPSLPVIYIQAPTPAPPAPPANGASSKWTTHSAMPTSRAGLALVGFKNQLFAIGGVRDNNQATRSVEIYDIATQSWSEGASKPSPATNIFGAVLDDKIYVPGGCTNQGQAVNTLDIYDPAVDEWAEGKALPGARCGYGLAVFENRLYLFGGWDGTEFKDTILTYSPESDVWTILEETLPQPLGFMGASVLGEDIYIVGGYNGDKEFNHTYAFSPGNGEWTQKASMQEVRGGLGLVSTPKNLYAIGGGWDHALKSSEKYDPASDTWSTFETPFNSQWRNLGLTAIDTTLYAAGGWDGETEEFMDSVVSFQFLYQLFLPISTFDQNPTDQN